jgi:type IV secretion system protein TrbF
MIFKRTQQRYGRTLAPESPYQRAGKMWDERTGSARVQARNWRLMAFGGLHLSSALATGLLWQSVQSRVVPYVVEVDRQGAAQCIAAVGADYQPTDPQIAWHFASLSPMCAGYRLIPCSSAKAGSPPMIMRRTAR